MLLIVVYTNRVIALMMEAVKTLKCRSISTRQLGAASQKTAIFTPATVVT
jgi:hypothetical protein